MSKAMIDDESEKTIPCPYNKAHAILRKRMALHLIQCRRQYPNSKKSVCPYNSTHVYNEEELKFHMETCESRGILDGFLYGVGSGAERPASALPVENMVINNVGTESSWDSASVSVLDEVRENAQKKQVLRMSIGGTKSERKAFKEQERRRVDALESRPTPKPGNSQAQFSWGENSKSNDKPSAYQQPPQQQQQSFQAPAKPATTATVQQIQEPPQLGDIQQSMANLSTQQMTRDKSNPWGKPSQSRPEVSYATEFPALGLGRGRGVRPNPN